MTTEQTAYYWDRLLRAAVRIKIMTQDQRNELAVTIEMNGPDPAMASAAATLVSGTLTTEDVKPHFQKMDTDSYRTSLAPAKDPSAKVDAHLAELIG